MKHLLAIMLCALSVAATAQKGSVRGRVVDARSGESIEYATVALLSPKDSTLKAGTVSESNGSFGGLIEYSIEIPFEMPHFVRQPKPQQ